MIPSRAVCLWVPEVCRLHSLVETLEINGYRACNVMYVIKCQHLELFGQLTYISPSREGISLNAYNNRDTANVSIIIIICIFNKIMDNLVFLA